MLGWLLLLKKKPPSTPFIGITQVSQMFYLDYSGKNIGLLCGNGEHYRLEPLGSSFDRQRTGLFCGLNERLSKAVEEATSVTFVGLKTVGIAIAPSD